MKGRYAFLSHNEGFIHYVNNFTRSGHKDRNVEKKHLIDWWIGTRKLYLHTVFVSSNLLHKNIQKILELYGKYDREPLSISCSSIWNLFQHFAKSLFCQIQFHSIQAIFLAEEAKTILRDFLMAPFATNFSCPRDSPLHAKWCMVSFDMIKGRKISWVIGILRRNERQDVKFCSRRQGAKVNACHVQ